MPSDTKDGTCRWCEEKRPVFKDNDLCELCDGDVVRCDICKSEQHRDDTCRHVFQDRHYDWRGSGAGWERNDELKAPFFRLLELMPDGFAADLRTAIRSGKFYTWFVAPMIGGGGILELNGMPERDGKWMVHAWGDALVKIGEGDHAEETADAYRWLVSLYEKKTSKANSETVKWINEWLAALPAA
jgi:hypothetical protein